MAQDNIFRIVYKTTNILNNMIYVGQHTTTNLNDGYIGSGTKLNQAIYDIGKEFFIREILEYADDYNDLNKKESKWIEILNSNNPNIGYNLKSSCGGGGILNEEVKELISIKTKEGMQKDGVIENLKLKANLRIRIPHTKETKEKISKSNKGKHQYLLEYNVGKIVSDETKKKLSAAAYKQFATKGHPGVGISWEEKTKNWSDDRRQEYIKKQSDSHKGHAAWNKGIPQSDETKKKISDAIKRKNKEKKYGTGQLIIN